VTSHYRTAEQLEAALPDALAAPRDAGALEMIVVRPAPGQRLRPASARLTPEAGVEGDAWTPPPGPDGQPNTAQAVSLMNARLLRLVAGDDPERMALAGDNLIVDLDTSAENLPPGQKLAVGEALLEVTGAPHTGCGAFSERFGPDAARFVNNAQRKALHLRGRYARVLQAGAVHVGDTVRKVD
jgi:MOSC domain-containing protein YiiM